MADAKYVMQWTPSVHHIGWLSEKSENLMRISGVQAVMIHPDDAASDGIADDQMVLISSGDTTLNLPAKLTRHVNRGEVLIINSFAENPVNSLMKKDNLITRVSVKRA